MAQKIYVAQTALILELDTKIDLTDAITAKMKYIKPDNTTGEWTAVIETPLTDGIISYTIAGPTTLDQEGIWKRWAYITFTGGTVAPGDPISFTVYSEGT